jgi:hypothetical protein
MRLLRRVLCVLCAFLYTDTFAQPVASANVDLVFAGVVVKMAGLPAEGTNENRVVSTSIETIESGRQISLQAPTVRANSLIASAIYQ